MNQLPSFANQSISSLDQLPLLGYPEFSPDMQHHIRVLRLLAYSFVALGLSVIASALVYHYLWQTP